MPLGSSSTTVESGGVVRDHIWAFYISLKSNAAVLLATASDRTKVVGGRQDEAQRLRWGGVTGLVSASSLPMEQEPAVPTEELIHVVIHKLGELLRETHGTSSCRDGFSFSQEVVAYLESIDIFARAIAWYCWVNMTITEGSFDFASSMLADCQRNSQQPRVQRKNNSNNMDGVFAENAPHNKDTQMAEKIFGVGVESVLRLSTCGALLDADSGCDTGAAKADEVHGFSRLCADVRASVLYMLTAALMRFRGATFNVTQYLPMLFPEVDARESQVRHPLLTPLLRDTEGCVSAAAATLLSALLRKLQASFKYAEEPQRKRQSFLSLASLSGRVLASVHTLLLWALQAPNSLVTREDSSGNAIIPLRPGKGVYFSVFSSLVAVTPYDRCPHSRDVVSSVLRNKILREALASDDVTQFKPAAAFLCEVFKSESLVDTVGKCLSTDGDFTDARTINVSTGEKKDNNCHMTLLNSLLVHVAKRVEVWRCIVQLARLHPCTVNSYFSSLVTASRVVVQEFVRLTELVTGSDAACTENMAKMAACDTTLGECLRGWVHFMGYVWQSFDGHSGDPALRSGYTTHRATQLQRSVIITELAMPALQLTRRGLCYVEARCAALRCVAHVGDEYLLSINSSAREEIIRQVIAGTTAPENGERAEAFTTIGVWTWQYSSLDNRTLDFIDHAAPALFADPCAPVRSKAAFALSNITSRLVRAREKVTIRDEVMDSAVHEDPLMQSPRHIQLLCDVAFFATQQHDDLTVVGHGIRMMGHLLGSLPFEDLIGELTAGRDQKQQVVAEAFFDALLHFLLPTNRDAKLRWNAACALGFGLSREVTFDAEPRGATCAVERLCTVVSQDRIFKVRTQAATALGRVPPSCLVAGRYATTDLTPVVALALCDALRQVVGDAAETYTQYREQDTLREALRQGLSMMVTGARSSEQLQHIFAEFRALLEAEGLL